MFSDEKQHKKDGDYTSRRRGKNLQILFDNTTVIPFEWKNDYLCFYCDKVIPEYTELRKHTKSHGKSGQILKFTSDTEIKIDISQLYCVICELKLEDLNELTKHLTSHAFKYECNMNTNIQTFKLVDFSCTVCEKQFLDFNTLYKHTKDVHPRKSYDCANCTKKFDSEHGLERHIENTHEKTTCSNCHKVFSTKRGYVKHISQPCIKIEPNTEDDVVPTNKPNLIQLRQSIADFLNMSTVMPFKFYKQRFRCFYCTKDFTDFEPLRVHTAEHSYCDPQSKRMKIIKGNYINIKLDITSMSCKICCEVASDINTMIKHLVSNHKVKFDDHLTNALQPFKLIKDNMSCSLCPNVSYRYISKLLEHMNEFHSNDKIICSYCGMTFGKDPNYRSHLKRHHNPKGSKCADCDLQFDNVPKLANHRARVHGEKLYKCPKCFETFATQYKKLKHLIDAHGTGIPCSYCGKLFTRNSFMKDHIRRSHLKEKNVECSVCKERFFDNILLRIHMVKHIGERNFHCDICGKSFLWKKNLRGHMSSHK